MTDFIGDVPEKGKQEETLRALPEYRSEICL